MNSKKSKDSKKSVRNASTVNKAKGKKADGKKDKKIETKKPSITALVNVAVKEGAKKQDYKRGALGKAVNQYLGKCNDKNIEPNYDQALEIALAVLPTTKFNRYHFSWYKNKFSDKLLAGVK